MFAYSPASLGKILIIHLSRGDLVLENIQKEIDRAGIRNGIVLSAIGSARKIVYHRIESLADSPQDRFFTVEAPIEISGISGLIINGKPHLHITFSDLERSYAGHLEPGCEVQYLAEIAIAELNDMPIVRKTNDFGVSYMDIAK